MDKKENNQHVSVPIRDKYDVVKYKVVGVVSGQEFRKNVVGSHHFLRVPPAIAFDIDSLHEAKRCGATYVRVHDNETSKDYYANISTIFQHGFQFDRGHGPQIALIFKFWEHERPAPQLSFIEKGE